MAEKPGFLILHTTFRALDELPDAQFRALMRAMCDYSESGREPTFDDAMMRAMFITIKDGLDMDKIRYERKVEQRKRAIEKRWNNERAKKSGESDNGADDSEAYESLRTDTTVYDRIRPNTDEYERYQYQNQSQIQVQDQIQNQNQVQSLSLSEREGAERERPTLEMVLKYAQEAGLEVDARQFIAQNEATGWVDGNGQPVKNWRIWLQGWALRNRPGGAAKPTPTAMAFEQRTYTVEELKAMTDADFENALKNFEKGKREDNG